MGNCTFFLKIFLENAIFLDNLIFLENDFLRKNDCIFLFFFASEVDSEAQSTLRKTIFKREASRVEGYVTPSCPEIRLSVKNLRKLEKT